MRNIIIKTLKFLLILQEVSNKNRNPELGKGFFTARRLNPYNPLSYIVVIILFAVALVLFGIVGMWSQIDNRNPLKWY